VTKNTKTYKKKKLKQIYLRLRKIVVERVTVVKFRVDNRGSDGTGCFRIEVRTDTAELLDMRRLRIARGNERLGSQTWLHDPFQQSLL